jgi:CelD/BcsL family acetyltransferase involved in cellulose biosynthesis
VAPGMGLPCWTGGAAIEQTLDLLRSRRGYALHVFRLSGVRRSLPGTWKEFYRSLHKSMKDNVNNYSSRLRREGRVVRLEVATDPEQVDRLLGTFLHLHELRAAAPIRPKNSDRIATSDRRAFLRAVSQRLSARGWFWLAVLYVDDRPAASELYFAYQECLYRYYSGFDPEFAKCGVMTVLTRVCIERGIEQGLTQLDLLLGATQEKLRWGVVERPVENVVMASRRVRSRAGFLLYDLDKRRKERRQ